LARLILEIDIGQRVAVVVPDDEAGIVRIIESSMAAGSGAASQVRHGFRAPGIRRTSAA